MRQDFPEEFDEIIEVLGRFRLPKSALVTGGGNKNPATSGWIDSEFYKKGWCEKEFDIKIKVDEAEKRSPTHSIDCFKNKVGLEIEWNNKDPFFDRDLNNFRLLHSIGVLSVGVIVTRCDELQEIVKALGRGGSFGQATTHMSKLIPKIEGGGAGGCPVLVFGISRKLYDENR